MVDSGSGIGRIGRYGAGICAALVVLALSPAAAQAEPPTVTIAAPSPGALTNESSTTFLGSTNDSLDSVTVDIYQGTGTGGARIREELAVPTGSEWSVKAQPLLPDGTYTAVAQQGAVEVGFSAEVTFTVDATAPAVTLDAVAPATNTSTPSFEGSAGTAPGDAETVSVTVFAGSSAGGQEAAAGVATVHSGRWSFTSPALSDGTYTVQASQGDDAGNVETSAAGTFRVDTAAPAPLSLNAVPAVFATATPSFGGAGGQETGDGAVRVVIDGKLAGEAAVSNGSWALASPQLSNGNHTVRAEQVDEAGNVSTTSTASFRVDTSAPAPTIAGPKSGEVLKSSLVEFHGGAGSATGDSPEITVEVFSGESTAVENLEQSFTASRSGSSWSSGSSGPRLSNGTYTVRVKQLDSVGNTGVSPTVTFVVDSPAPSVTLNELPRFTADATPSFSGSADTTAEAKPEVTLKVWRGTSASGSLAEFASGPASVGAWSLGLAEPLPDGTYTAQAEQPPVAKNQAGVSETTTFTVDTQAPQPTLSVPGGSTGLETVSGSAGTAPGDRRQVTAELFSGGSAEGAAIETITVLDSADGTWSATFAGLGGGQYTVLARQSDEAGNTGSSAAQSFTVSSPPPPAGPSAPVASFTWVPQTPTVGQSVSLVSKSTDASSAITGYGWDLSGGGPFAAGGSVMTTTFATPGAHTVRLQVIDANGLSSTVAETIQVAPQALTLMQPFPIVRIAGAETSGGARIKLLTVQAPTGAKVAVSCKGRGCKTKNETRLATASSKSKGKSRAGAITLAFPRFQRTLGAGAMLQIRITKSGQIGKFTSFKIRRRKLPVRVDACLRPPSTAPSPCPSQ
jgi:large repetitive protein